MKIYLASSWKTKELVNFLAFYLRSNGNEVDAFCDSSTGRPVFEAKKEGFDFNQYTAKTFLEEPKALECFERDKSFIDWADAVIMVLPCGKSAHLEAGYAKGQGKKLWIFGDLPYGDVDVMYGFADGVYDRTDFYTMMRDIYQWESTLYLQSLRGGHSELLSKEDWTAEPSIVTPSVRGAKPSCEVSAVCLTEGPSVPSAIPESQIVRGLRGNPNAFLSA